MRKLIVLGTALLCWTGCGAPSESPTPAASVSASASPQEEPQLGAKTEEEAITQIDALGREGQFELARQISEMALKKWPKSWQLHAQHGAAVKALGDSKASVADYTEALKHAPPDQKWRLYNSRAQAEADLGQRETAEKDFQAALGAVGNKVDPRRIQAIHHMRGRNQVEALNYKAALPSLNKALDLDPDDHEALGLRALAYYRLKDMKKYQADMAALTALNRTTAEALQAQIAQGDDLSPSNQKVLQGLQAWQDNKLDLAMERFDQALTIDPKNSEAWHKKGALLQAQKKLAEAVAAYTRSYELDKSEAALYNRAHCYEELGQKDKAIADYQLFVATGTDQKALQSARLSLKGLQGK